MLGSKKLREQVNQLEDEERRHPKLYRMRVALLVLLGYTYLLTLLALMLVGLALLFWQALQLNFVAFSLIGALSVVAWILGRAIVRSLLPKTPAPKGLPLRRVEAPLLFATVEDTCEALAAPAVRRILLTHEYTAAMHAESRLGIFGWYHGNLLLGLPVLLALSQDQIRAVIAHEVAHLSRNLNWFGSWLYRVRQAWAELQQEIEWRGQPLLRVFYESFSRWYFPILDPYSSVLSRAHEYEADRCAAQATGRENTASCLLHLRLAERFLTDHFWPQVFKEAQEQIEPPRDVFGRMENALRKGFPREQRRIWLAEALQEKTNPLDSHPSLAERLTALKEVGGYSEILSDERPLEIVLLQKSAAEVFLGDALSALGKQIENAWWEQVQWDWRKLHRDAQQTRQELAALEAKVGDRSLTREEVWQRVQLTARLDRRKATLLLQDFLSQCPDHADAHLLLGEILLEKGEDAGRTHIQKAIELNPDHTLWGSVLVYGYLLRHGREAEAEQDLDRAMKQLELQGAINWERTQVHAEDSFVSHGLPASTVEGLRHGLERLKRVEVAYLVRKTLKHSPEKLPLVLGLVLRKKGQITEFRGGVAFHDELSSALALGGEFRVVILDRSNRKLRKVLAATPRAEIYRCSQ